MGLFRASVWVCQAHVWEGVLGPPCSGRPAPAAPLLPPAPPALCLAGWRGAEKAARLQRGGAGAGGSGGVGRGENGVKASVALQGQPWCRLHPLPRRGLPAELWRQREAVGPGLGFRLGGGGGGAGPETAGSEGSELLTPSPSFEIHAIFSFLFPRAASAPPGRNLNVISGN